MPRKLKKEKTGGGLNFPAQYFNPDADIPKYYPAGSPELKLPASSYGPSSAVSYGRLTGPSYPNMVGPNYGPAHHKHSSTNIQTGGSSPYDYIINPLTNHKVSLFSKKGKSILKYYINAIQ